jgi:hypothetical protein
VADSRLTTTPAKYGPRPELRLSATSESLWELCKRKWGFVFNEGYEEHAGATGLGTRVHKILEDYLTQGTAPDLTETYLVLDKRKTDAMGVPLVHTYYPGQIASAGLGHLPPPGSALCEQTFAVPTQSITWVGQMDFKYLDGKRHLPVVGDHKTSTDKKWTKTPEVLAVDSQGVLYPHALSVETGSPTIVDRWVYYLTKAGKNPDSWVSEYVSTPEARQPILDKMDGHGVQMALAYERQTPALALPANPDSCQKFGGCPHYGTRCNLTLTEILGYEKKGSDMDFRAFLAAQEQAGPAPVAPTPQAITMPAAPAPTAAPASPYWKPGDPMNETQSYLAGANAPMYSVMAAADNPPPPHILNALISAVNPAAVLPSTNPGHINPPEAPTYAPATPSQMPQVTALPLPTSAPVAPTPTAPAITMPFTPVAPAMALPEAEPADTVQDEYTGKTREELKAIAISRGLIDASSKARIDGLRNMLRAALPSVLSQAAQVLAPKPTDNPQPRTARPKNLGVYVGCYQVGLETVPLSTFLGPILDKLRAETGIPHWGLEDFGKGGARLSAALEAYLNHHHDEYNIFVDIKSAEAAHCLPVLLRFAEVVVRATF